MALDVGYELGAATIHPRLGHQVATQVENDCRLVNMSRTFARARAALHARPHRVLGHHAPLKQISLPIAIPVSARPCLEFSGEAADDLAR